MAKSAILTNPHLKEKVKMTQMFVGTQEKYSPNVNTVYLNMPKGIPTPNVPSTSGPRDSVGCRAFDKKNNGNV